MGHVVQSSAHVARPSPPIICKLHVGVDVCPAPEPMFRVIPHYHTHARFIDARACMAIPRTHMDAITTGSLTASLMPALPLLIPSLSPPFPHHAIYSARCPHFPAMKSSPVGGAQGLVPWDAARLRREGSTSEAASQQKNRNRVSAPAPTALCVRENGHAHVWGRKVRVCTCGCNPSLPAALHLSYFRPPPHPHTCSSEAEFGTDPSVHRITLGDTGRTCGKSSAWVLRVPAKSASLGRGNASAPIGRPCIMPKERQA